MKPNEYNTPDDGREWVPAESWQDNEFSNLLAAAVDAEANYATIQQEDMNNVADYF